MGFRVHRLPPGVHAQVPANHARRIVAWRTSYVSTRVGARTTQVEPFHRCPILAALGKGSPVDDLILAQLSHLDISSHHVWQVPLDIERGDSENVNRILGGQILSIGGQVPGALVCELVANLVPPFRSSLLFAQVSRGYLPKKGRALARRGLGGIMLTRKTAQELK